MNERSSSVPPAPDGDEFFIGYDPPMPAGIACFVRRAVIAIGLAVVVGGFTLGPAHRRLEGGSFEFGHPRAFSGTIVESPVPALRPDGDSGATPWPLLVGQGKHGAAAAVAGLAGHHVTLTGTRIVRGTQTMIELQADSLVAGPLTDAVPRSETAGVPIQLRGQIVDSKCFLGVMVPGAGTTHKACAALCLRGGIPPALFVQDRTGASTLLLVTGPAGEPLTAQVVRVAGEAIELTGTITRVGGWLVVRTDPATWRTLDN